MKKVLILFLTLLLLPWEVTAASKNFKIIDPALYQDILKRTGISAEEVETYKDLFTAVENGETDKAAGLQKKLKTRCCSGMCWRKSTCIKVMIQLMKNCAAG